MQVWLCGDRYRYIQYRVCLLKPKTKRRKTDKERSYLFHQKLFGDVGDRVEGWTPHRRRRINTEEKAKVVVAAWGTEFVQFRAELATVFCTIG